MKLTSALTVILSLTILTAACSNAKPDDTQSKETSTPASTVSPAPSSQPSASPKQTSESEKKPIQIRYQMNANYDIKPIDPNKDASKVVLLTFDDGPKDLTMIDSMLATLNKHHAKAIFFVNGYRIKAQPALLTKLFEAGQTIGNHSYDHIALGKETTAVIEKQITSVQAQVKELTGQAPRFFRPPFASSNDEVRRIAKEQNMLFMTWSNGSLDWDGNNQTPTAVVKNVMEQLHPGSNILMHELHWTVEALDTLLTQLENAGYSFVNPEELSSQPI
jgi:peptidoglycan/xylan/chitin deacetylase (PgdA/CDA1 family)